MIDDNYLEHYDVTISPTDPGSSKHVIRARSDRPDTRLPHLRRTGKASGDISDIARIQFDPALKGLASRHVQGPALYAGIYFRHFGHFVAECIHRLYARHERSDLRNAPIFFHASGVQAKNRLEPWLFPVLEACGVDRGLVHFIDRPIFFEHLVVPPQARIIAGLTLKSNYASVFPPLEARPAPCKGGSYYVSRSSHFFSGNFAGESLVENWLSEAGFEIIQPEKMVLKDVIAKISGAERIIFTEGSGIHNLELCGKTGAKMMLISRRRGAITRFGPLMTEYSASWTAFTDVQEFGSLEWDPFSNAPNPARAISVLDIQVLLKQICVQFELNVEIPNLETCKRAVHADLARYILDDRTTRGEGTTFEQLGSMLTAMRSRYNQWVRKSASL